MIIPSVDIMDGKAVQLIGGKELEIDAGDPRAKLREFRIAGEVAVIDLDAAMSQGSNAAIIEEMLRLGKCRVGGGIRDLETAISWLDKGASKIILGTKAVPEILSQLPRERVQAALDADNGEVVVEGWKEKTGRGIIERMLELRDCVGGFLVTFVEKEGRMQGTNLDLVAELVQAAGDCALTIAGGVTTEEDLRTLDAMGVDAQVGMALYSGRLDLGDSLSCVMKTDSPWPTIICDRAGVAQAFGWSTKETIRASVASQSLQYLLGPTDKKAVRGSGNLISLRPDYDRQVIRFSIEGNALETAWGTNSGLVKLEALLKDRLDNAPQGSYSKRLFEDKSLLNSKILEEAGELVAAENSKEICWEAADVFYFAMTKMAQAGVSLSDIEEELEGRSLKVSRRPGNAKPLS
jgi:phosphoribosyl-ATP pyrophosphohydrolase